METDETEVITMTDFVEFEVAQGASLEQGDMQEQIAQREEIRRVVANLNAEQRRVIALRYGANLTESEIANVLGWPQCRHCIAQSNRLSVNQGSI